MAHDRARPVKSEPGKINQDLLPEMTSTALKVDVFNSQEEFAAEVACSVPRLDGGVRMSKMQEAGR